MTERERLTELIETAVSIMQNTPEKLTDYLLNHGIIVPPCKVGDTVYSTRSADILKQKVSRIEIGEEPRICVDFSCDYQCDGCPHSQPYENIAGDGGCWGEYGEGTIAFDDFSKTVFTTREEAEAALAKRRKS